MQYRCSPGQSCTIPGSGCHNSYSWKERVNLALQTWAHFKCFFLIFYGLSRNFSEIKHLSRLKSQDTGPVFLDLNWSKLSLFQICSYTERGCPDHLSLNIKMKYSHLTYENPVFGYKFQETHKTWQQMDNTKNGYDRKGIWQNGTVKKNKCLTTCTSNWWPFPGHADCRRKSQTWAVV